MNQKQMKIVFGIMLAVSLLALMGAPVAFAQLGDAPSTIPAGDTVPSSPTKILTLVGTIGNWIFVIFLAASLIFIILAAFQFVTGGGQPEQISAARQKLIYAAVGIGIALLAGGFDDILKSILVDTPV